MFQPSFLPGLNFLIDCNMFSQIYTPKAHGFVFLLNAACRAWGGYDVVL